MSKIKKLFKILGIILAILAVVVVIFKLVINPYKVAEADDIEYFDNGQIVLTYDRRVFSSELEKGDVVVFSPSIFNLIGVVSNQPGEVVEEAVDYTNIQHQDPKKTERIELTSAQYGVKYSGKIYVVTDSAVHHKAWWY